MTVRRAGTEYIGVNCAFVCHDGRGRVLLHRRGLAARDHHEVWDSGSGELEFGEAFDDCVVREVREEFGVTPREITEVGVGNFVFGAAEGLRQWVAVQFAVRIDPEAALQPEAGKVGEFAWFAQDALPEGLHPALPDLLSAAADVLNARS